MPVFNNQLAGAAGQGGEAAEYVIPKSLRFNSGDSAYLSRTPSAEGNQRTFTWSFWIKRSKVTDQEKIIFAGDSSSKFVVEFSSNEKIGIQSFTSGSTQTNLASDAVYRDPSAWAHYVISFSTTEATAANRVKFYVNGVEQTLSGTYPSQNAEITAINDDVVHVIGREDYSNGQYLNAYLADIQLVDGQALAPTDFGETRSSDGVWVPKKFNGNYGTNGFKLDFSDSSTNEALGFDSAVTVPALDPKKGMDVITYTGNGGTQNIGGLNFEPGLVWIKRRTGSAKDHCLVDVVRGPKKRLRSESTAQETTEEVVTAFDPGGFTIGTDTGVNQSGYNFVAWTWAAGGSAVSNTSGTINAEVSANTDYGFSIVKWTATNTSGTIGHGLTSQTPKFILVKSTASGTNWVVYHHSLGNTKGLNLNLSGTGGTGQDFWNNTSPTTSVFSVGSFANYQTAEHVAYVWSEVSGYSKFGSYNGSGSANVKVTTGFKPRFIIARPIDDSNGNRWHIVDTERGVTAERIFAEDNAVHSARQEVIIEDDGFTVINTTTDSGSLNRNTEYIYAAFADRPGNNWDVNNIVTNEGLTTSKDNFDVVTYTGNGGTQKIGGPVYSNQTTGGNYPDRMFDGSGSTWNNLTAGNTLTFTPGPAIACTQLELWMATDTPIRVNVNGTGYGSTFTQSGLAYVDITPSGGMTSLTSLVIDAPSGGGGSGAGLNGVRINGTTILVDGNGGPGLKFQPDFVWCKARSFGADHELYDSVRGVNKRLYSSLTNTESTTTTAVSSFNSDGFTVNGGGGVNNNNATYVAWCWKAGGTAVSNTDGSITSSVSANPNGGFSIVSYTGTGANATVGHGLGKSPDLIIIKNRNTALGDAWRVWASVLAANERLVLSGTNALGSGSTLWQNTLPTSSVFYLDNDARYNTNGDDHIAYCFANVPGYQRISSYTGNGSDSGPTVVCGFKPRFVLLKNINDADDWKIYDSERDPVFISGVNQGVLSPNSSSSELQNKGVEFTASGFTVKDSNNSINGSGDTIIYLAIGDDEIGSDEDCLVDVPNAVTADADATDTTGGYQRGNYCTFNPLDKRSNVSLSNGNLEATTTSSHWSGVKGTLGVSSGKYYFEVTYGDGNDGRIFVGICGSDVVIDPSSYVQDDTTERAKGMLLFCDNGQYQLDTANRVNMTSQPVSGDVLGVSFDLDANTAQFYKNGSALGSIDISSSGLASTTVVPIVVVYQSGVKHVLNCGQMRFKYGLPSGYAALNTTALPPATIKDGSKYFDIDLYSGTGASHTRSGFSFSPDWVWIKVRDAGSSHRVFDTVRGAGKHMNPDGNGSEETHTAALSAFTSDGYTLGANNDGATNVNQSNKNYVAWLWDAGSSTVSNTDGTITSSVRANPSAGFSIITYTGNGSANQTIGHGLNDKPSLIIIKSRDNARNWVVIPTFINDRHFLYLNDSSDLLTGLTSYYGSHTSSVVGITGSSSGTNSNANGEDYLCYAFAPVAGYSAFGSYTGNGSGTDGPFIYTGFKPALVVIKRTDSANDWNVQDYQRKSYNGQLTTSLQWNTSSSESSVGSGYERDILSNGFKIRNTGTETNASGGTYLYIAFAQNPFQANGGLAR